MRPARPLGIHRERADADLGVLGHVEPQIERDEGRVQVLNVWWEDGFAPRRADGFVEAMREALRAYLSFAGLEQLAWPSHLAAEKRLFLARP